MGAHVNSSDTIFNEGEGCLPNQKKKTIEKRKEKSVERTKKKNLSRARAFEFSLLCTGQP